jgi:hypothetical protein
MVDVLFIGQVGINKKMLTALFEKNAHRSDFSGGRGICLQRAGECS